MQNKFAQFQKSYDDAVAMIHVFLQPGQYEPQMNGLVQWMMETDANPYSYLPHNWGHAVESAEGFVSLLHYIHHAVYDDGDITFVTVDSTPRIVFAHKSDEDFRDQVLTDQEKDIEKDSRFMRAHRYEIKVLDIEPNEFGPLYNTYQVDDLKRCFISDASRQEDIEWAAQNYRKYKCWDESWITECEQEIEKETQHLRSLGILG